MRIPPPASHIISPAFGQTVASLRESLTRTAEEATTGRYSDLTAHLSGRIGTAMLSQKAVEDIGLRREQLSLREGRLEVTQRSLTLINERVAGLDTKMRDAVISKDQRLQGLTARDAEAALGQVFNLVNVRFGERFLFAGDATDTQPLGSPGDLLDVIRNLADVAASSTDFAVALDTYFNAPGGGWQTSALRSAINASDPDAVTANDASIVKLISGLAVMALSDPASSPALFRTNPEISLAGAEQVSAGLSDLTNLRADRGVTQSQIEMEKASLDIEETIFTKELNSLWGRDQYEAATALKQLETALEASFMLTSRLSSLSLLNFLR